MKINIACPSTGCQKTFEIDDEHKLRNFFGKRIAAELDLTFLGDEWSGYSARITGGCDKQGFPMKQGILTNNRVRLLLRQGFTCYKPRRDGERKRRSLRGCIVDGNLSMLCLAVTKKGTNDIPGLTDKVVPRKLGPKRASKIRKLFNLSKTDDVRKYVVRKPLPDKEGKKSGKKKAPKIQRLVTEVVRQRKRRRFAQNKQRIVKNKEQAAEYAKLLQLRAKEARERKAERKRSTSKSRSSESGGKVATK